MALILRVALVVTECIERYRIGLALESILADLLVETTTRLQMFWIVNFRTEVNIANLAVLSTRVPFHGDLQRSFPFLASMNDFLSRNRLLNFGR